MKADISPWNVSSIHNPIAEYETLLKRLNTTVCPLVL